MNKIAALDEIRDDLCVWIEKTAKHMGESAVVVSIFTDNYKENIDGLLQFAVSVMLDKPLFLLVPEGTKIPEKVLKIADGIEFFTDDPVDAGRRLLDKARAIGKL